MVIRWEFINLILVQLLITSLDRNICQFADGIDSQVLLYFKSVARCFFRADRFMCDHHDDDDSNGGSGNDGSGNDKHQVYIEPRKEKKMCVCVCCVARTTF